PRRRVARHARLGRALPDGWPPGVSQLYFSAVGLYGMSDRESAGDLLRKKAMLLLRREQELYLLRRSRQRTDAWLYAFHRLSADPASPNAVSDEWAEVMIREL